MRLEELVAISQFYGSNSGYVIAGGGNTSFKDEKYLYIKGSGTSLANIEPEGFVKMERGLLSGIWEKTYPEEADKREAAVLADMMAARAPGEEQKRPSVETLLHDLLPFTFVVHTHPSLVNGLTCSVNGEAAAAELFAGDALWIPSTNPGYILSRKVKELMEEFKTRRGKPPAIIFLQNHGVFVGADTVEEIKAIYRRIMDTLEAKIIRKPDISDTTYVYKFSEWFGRLLCGFGGRTEKEHDWYVQFRRNAEIARFVQDRASFAPVSSAFTPDHIVYSGSSPLFIEDSTDDPSGKAADAWKTHLERTGIIPKTIAYQGMGVFGIGISQKAADNAVELFIDTVKVAVYAESFGGGRFMSEDQISFINNWEVERYRSALLAK
ncbi:MAG: class II aldolase/adducin family protein [Treponema sp.]|jgi:rhamnose utilization protein RhaD (predicted bifunctional aldolase and dehydrogenase)|nr:class II aldolase/adducin family protein [Treponema sp.]